MKLHHRFLLPMVAVTIVASAGAFIVTDRMFSAQMNASVDATIQAKLAELEAYQTQIEQRCLSHAALFGRHPDVIRAYQLARAGDMHDPDCPQAQAARELLRDAFGPMAANYVAATGASRYGLHFHLPTGRSLLRIWRDGQNASDDISAFRKTVIDINNGAHKPLVGVEVGRGGFVIRGLAPVTDPNGAHLGSVEMLSAYTPLVMAAQTCPTQAFGVYMNADLLSVANRLNDPAEYPQIGGRYVLTAATDAELLQQAVPVAQLDAGANERATARHGAYAVTTVPVRDYAGGQIGVLAFVLENSQALAQIATMRCSIALGAAALVTILTVTALVVGKHVAKTLDRITDGLAQGSDQINEAADQVSQTAQHLAAGANEQAAATEKTSRALLEMSQMSEANHKDSQKANALTEEARKAAVGGEDTMRALNAAMEQLNDSSGQIRKIIRVIEEIAFQTNLLALNAAVEAARAGEHGKGFAVVAEEVRNLAQRVASAAGETTALIEASVQNTQQSTEVATQAGQTFSEIVAGVSEITQLVGNIAMASSNQAQGVQEINQSVARIDELTQQSAATAEESASAAEELNGMSVSLKDQLVGDLIELSRGTRRRHRRQMYVAATEVSGVSQGRPVTLQGRTHDASASGLGLFVPEALDSDTPVTLSAPLRDGDTLPLSGRVAHCRPDGQRGYRVGIELNERIAPNRLATAGESMRLALER